MNSKKLFSAARRLLLFVIAAVLVLAMSVPALAADEQEPYQEIDTSQRDTEFTYELFLTDQSGMPVTNPRKLAAGDRLNVEIRLTRNGFNGPSYDSYGIEFRLLTRGLTYNYDGVTLRSGTDVREMVYSDGNSVGFAWYDFQQIGESTNNPVLAGSWSYTVADPGMVNITVPVALVYVTGDSEEYVPTGPATLFLDPDGGRIVGEDVSGTYTSGTVVVLPEVQMGDWVFVGWSDGAHIYPAGSEYVVSGVVTLTAVWEELDRNRYLTLDLAGCEVVGEDISGYYADDEIVVLPDAQREGYKFLGWSDGVETYEANAEYVVYNTVTITALWEEIPAAPAEPLEPTEPTEPGENGDCIICDRDHSLIPIIPLCWLHLLILLLLLLVIILILLLLLRRPVKYSLVNGDVSLNFKNGKTPVEVEAVLRDGEKEYRLNKSGIVEVRNRLRFIKNETNIPVAEVKTGTYKGKLLIHEGGKVKVKKCRIKALDRKLDE